MSPSSLLTLLNQAERYGITSLLQLQIVTRLLNSQQTLLNLQGLLKKPLEDIAAASAKLEESGILNISACKTHIQFSTIALKPEITHTIRHLITTETGETLRSKKLPPRRKHDWHPNPAKAFSSP